MPTYQYVCTSCGEPLEAVQSLTDASLTTCPTCSGALRKVFTSVGVTFKGSGFYRNDSRAATKPAEGDSASEKKSENKEKKQEKKPAASSTGSSS